MLVIFLSGPGADQITSVTYGGIEVPFVATKG